MLMTEKTKSKKKKPANKGKAVSGKDKARPVVDTAVLDPLIGYHLRRAMAAVIRSYNQNVLGGAIRPGLASLMRLVATNHGASQVDLSRALQVDKASLVALIDTAEENGWLRRQRSKVDRRRHEVTVTAKGKKVVAELAEQTLQNEKQFYERFTEKELANLLEYLQRIYTKAP